MSSENTSPDEPAGIRLEDQAELEIRARLSVLEHDLRGAQFEILVLAVAVLALITITKQNVSPR